MSYPRQIVTGFTRRKPRHVRQTRSFWLAAFGMLILSHIAGAQPLGINPSAAPSDLGNPSSINPAARASDVWNPSAINPAAAASQIPQPSGILEAQDAKRQARASSRSHRCRVSPPSTGRRGAGSQAPGNPLPLRREAVRRRTPGRSYARNRTP